MEEVLDDEEDLTKEEPTEEDLEELEGFGREELEEELEI